MALQQAASDREMTVEALLADVKRAVARAGRLERGVERQREAHRIPISDAERLAAAGGVDLDGLYDADRLQPPAIVGEFRGRSRRRRLRTEQAARC